MRRTLVLWCPGWSLVSAYGDDSLPEVVPGIPVAILHKGLVSECSPEASASGVRVGMRRRDAHLMCPGLVLSTRNDERDRDAFDRVLIDLAQCVSEHSLLSPGLVAFHARGLARFYGSEDAGARMVMDALTVSQPLATARVGIADDLFTGVIAAHHTSEGYPLRSVGAGESAAFLSDISVSALDDEATVSLLLRLGVTTLGGFVALGSEAIRDRLGVTGERLYRLASGGGDRYLTLSGAPLNVSRKVELPEALVSVDQVSFALRVPTEDYATTLSDAGVVCTQVQITLGFDNDTTHQRLWRHPRYFQASDLVDRVRWQLEQCFRNRQDEESAFPLAVAWVGFDAVSPEDSSAHEPGLWGQGPDSRVHHVLSRIQGMVGAGGVLTARPRVARVAAEAHVLTPWGDSPQIEDAPGPLPGALPSPLPGTVFATPPEVTLISESGDYIVVSEQSQLSALPYWMVSGDRRVKLRSWAGPWPVWERWWDPTRSRFLHRVQLVDDNGMGWLVSAHDRHHWYLEARYD